MARNQKDFTYDADLRLKDAGAVTADAAGTVGGSAKVLDLGAARFNGRVILDVTALDVATGDEAYRIRTQFSNSASFASGIVNGPEQLLGDSTLTLGSADSIVGRYEIPFASEINGATYRYMRIYTDVSGATSVSIDYSAFVVQA